MSAVITAAHRPVIVPVAVEPDPRPPYQIRIAGMVAEFRRDIERYGTASDGQHALIVGSLMSEAMQPGADIGFIGHAIARVNQLVAESRQWERQ